MQLSAFEQAQVAELATLSEAMLGEGRAEEARDVLLALLAITPGDANLLRHLGDALHALGSYADAAECYAGAGQRDPKLSAHYANLHHAHLLRGEASQAWKAYEWRLAERGGPVVTRRFPIPQWRGEPIEGRTILVQAEQGLGDAIQFARYLRTLKSLGARVVFDVFGPLLRLFRSLQDVDVLVGPGEPLPPADVHTPLMSLPHAFDLGGIAVAEAEIPYLRADPEIVSRWTAELPTGAPKIGLAASGNPSHPHDARRSIPLEALAQGLPPGPAYVLIQQDARGADRAALQARPDIRLAGDALGDYADTAGLCAALDLVVSVDTSVAHLAGALGRPVRLMQPHFPEWRWEPEGETTRWYPTMRQLRQAEAGDWTAVTNALRSEINTLAN
jgi:hypothetical protein